MTELKLEQLCRGYVLTDFDGNKVGIKDSKHAIEEIEKLLNIGRKSGQSIVEKLIRKPKYNHVELHRNIFEKAKEQIGSYGKINCAKIARELNISYSNVRNHLDKMNLELDELIKKWQDERDKNIADKETTPNADDGKLNE